MVVAAPLLRLAIKGLGIAYLLWLAWKLAHSARLAEADAAQLTVGFWQGTALQFVNIIGLAAGADHRLARWLPGVQTHCNAWPWCCR